MSDKNPNPEHNEGDQAEEMKEEGSPVESTSDSSADTDTDTDASADVKDEVKDAVDRELEIFQDMQRLQADFVNYRSRVERDRGAERQSAISEAIRAFLPALDDLTRAESHGDLPEGSPMAAVAQKLRAAGEKFGLVSFGAKGERFDPELHDALVQNPNPEVTVAEVADVIEPGYKIQDRLLRPAKVAVFLPAE
ncbi:MAG: nucleotide exchange factor GrpE [Aquiluna sp.]|jgi:molecular chaperone GrpE